MEKENDVMAPFSLLRTFSVSPLRKKLFVKIEAGEKALFFFHVQLQFTGNRRRENYFEIKRDVRARRR